MGSRPLRPHELGRKVLREHVAALQQVLEGHPDVAFDMRMIDAGATDADAVCHLTDAVNDKLVNMLAEPRFDAEARSLGRALRDGAAARGERPPAGGGPVLLMALGAMDGEDVEIRGGL